MEERIVAFLDILGFTEMIDEYEKGEKGVVFQLQQTLDTALEILGNNERAHYDELLRHWLSYIEYRTFSDCICISIPKSITNVYVLENCKLFFQYVGIVQRFLMSLGHHYFLRGGISLGSYFATRNMLFSKALVEAYELESKHAIYPRVLIHENLLNYIDEEVKAIGYKLTPYPLITSFSDDKPFLNFLNVYITDDFRSDNFVGDLNLGQGMFGDSFEDQGLRRKNKDILDYIKIIKWKLANNPNYKEEVRLKYEWLLAFLIYQHENNGRSALAF